MVSQNSISNRVLESGNKYCLRKLFSGKNDKIVIPDLQRDYCWGTTNNLVDNFIDGIIKLWRNDTKDIIMGLIYGYKDPLTPEHIQLCDGQQRLTTLFLLIGMINKKSEGNPYEDCLISDFEYNRDDQEPYLQYSIRESSLYFLSDLTCFYFLNNSAKGNSNNTQENKAYYEGDICHRPWYKASIYDVDPTIQNILIALKTIEERLNNLNKNELKSLGDFVIEKILFLYCDMDNRANGEETFVIINTTGEPLTASQNLKPLFINQNKESCSDVAKRWETMETWFWRNRIKGEEHTADEGMEIFFHIVRILSDYPYESSEKLKDLINAKNNAFPYNKINGNDVFNYFDAYKKLYKICFATKSNRQTKRLDNKLQYIEYYTNAFNKFMYIVLPMLCYCHRFHNETTNDDIKRMFHLFSNMWKYQTRDLNSVAMAAMASIEMINNMDSKDIDSLKDSRILQEEEKRKLAILHNYTDKEREEIEYLFAHAEDNSILNGRLSIILDWSNNNVCEFEQYFKKMKDMWHQGKKDEVSDYLRCSLLAYELCNYPLDNYTLGSTADEWYKIIEKNKEDIKGFIDRATTRKQNGNVNYDDVFHSIVKEYENKENQWSPIIKNPKLLEKSNYKYVRVYPNHMIWIMNKQNSNAGYTIIFYDKVILHNLIWEWGCLHEYDGLLYTDHWHYDLTLELIHEKEAEGFRILLWEGKNKDRAKFEHINNIVEGDFTWNDNLEKWQTNNEYNGDEVVEKMKDIVHRVNSYIENNVNNK